MPKSTKKRRTFRFNDETMSQLDKGVAKKRRREPWWDRTKLLEWLVRLFAEGKVKG